MFDIINTNKRGLILIKARNWKFYIEKIFWRLIFLYQHGINVPQPYLSYHTLSSNEKTANHRTNWPNTEVDSSAKELLTKHLEIFDLPKISDSPLNDHEVVSSLTIPWKIDNMQAMHPYLYSSNYWCTLFMQSNMRTRLRGHRSLDTYYQYWQLVLEASGSMQTTFKSRQFQ